MKMWPEVILGQQLATQADGFLEIIDESLNSVTGSQMIMREQDAAGVCYLCAKRVHISVDCPGLKLGGPQNKAERIGNRYQSNVNMQNLPKLYEIRKKPILDLGAMMHQQAGTGIWHHNTPKNTQKQQHKKSQESSATGPGKAAGAMMWRLLISCLEQTRCRSSRRRWKLSGFLGKLIMHSTKFASTSMILPRTCEPEGLVLIPMKSAKEKLEMSIGELTRKQDNYPSHLFSVSHI